MGENPVSINGRSIDVSAVKPKIVAGNVITLEIKDRRNISDEYTSPPDVVVNFDAATPVSNSAVVKAVLFKDVIVNYSNENVKSIYCEFGEGNSNSFSCDVDTFNDEFTLSKNVTNFTFSGIKGKKFLTCLAFSGDASIELLVSAGYDAMYGARPLKRAIQQLLENQPPNFVKPSDKTVDLFIKTTATSNEIKKFFMEDIELLLEQYSPGSPDMKPDVLKQISDLTAKRNSDNASRNQPRIIVSDGKHPDKMMTCDELSTLLQKQRNMIARQINIIQSKDEEIRTLRAQSNNI